MFQSHEIASFNESQFLDFSEIVARTQKKGVSLTKMREQSKVNKFSFGTLPVDSAEKAQDNSHSGSNSLTGATG